MASIASDIKKSRKDSVKSEDNPDYPGYWFPVYIEDLLLGDISTCSPATQLLWIKLQALMYRNEKRGYLTRDGVPLSDTELARRTSTQIRTFLRSKQEMIDKSLANVSPMFGLTFPKLLANLQGKKANARRQEKFRKTHEIQPLTSTSAPTLNPPNPPLRNALYNAYNYNNSTEPSQTQDPSSTSSPTVPSSAQQEISLFVDSSVSASEDLSRNLILNSQLVERAKDARVDGGLVREIFDFWKVQCGHPNAKLTLQRQSKIVARLKEGYTKEQITTAIRGCSHSEFHQGGNDNGQKYDDLELICRNGSKIENFIEREKHTENGQGRPVSARAIDLLRSITQFDEEENTSNDNSGVTNIEKFRADSLKRDRSSRLLLESGSGEHTDD